MRSIATLAILFFAKLLVAQNLIINPGAETLPLVGNGWTVVNGLWTGSNNSPAFGEKAPRSGTYHFYAGDNSNYNSELYQDVDLSSYATDIDASNLKVTFSGYVANYGFNNDQAQMIVEYRDASNNVLFTISLPTTPYTGTPWSQYSDLNRVPPVGTRKVRVRLLSIYRSGSASDGYFDDLSLTVASVAPVKLVFFNAQVFNSQVLCTWQTANESNNKHFCIEKSVDALHWDSIGSVGGSINSTLATFYEFLDPSPLERLQYYRLKQVDRDGSFTYYPFRAVRPESNTTFTVYTNIDDQIVVEGTLIQKLDIYNIQGQLYMQLVAEELEEQLTVKDDLPSGSYIFKITTDAEIYTLRYIAP